ncbi:MULTISPECIES: MSMEG_0567/Sll0786 family nitrogen starvation N-acetyltransferase [Pseudonocardia]|uniref:Acetyltransferase (GNAT) family protein n=2 Tax=Pseudonocardia TaxID=1847 RepID=A0A1Y2N7R6_PSEAH|nr:MULTISPECIES: MSMEG_0567/Sll0786 family nitrogen starvation N-acetyltransferase [Pseudonocardia]OSY43493.1 Acetyltransferase (GNAT) family protein [Pseudonocardia autotrophica]TDN73513.1 putative N-acetyltransferase (TIGR04045 family) [Pseudonocardia autotrophica]BBG04257.1 hypothetical protein Pdca_54660 [Pseudonocardia autotrophica]GEC25600.1 hypothetical protein PSA01_26290 [Pseudonocardia saturnea]
MTAARPVGTRQAVEVRIVTGAELAEHHRIRHAVFVVEQEIFTGDDLDRHDADPDTLHVLAIAGGEPVGTVRLYPVGAGCWRGDRLAVLPGRRVVGAGGPLVRFAVATAGERGGTRMVAHVQPPNRAFFERLGWTTEGLEDYAGFTHVAMSIPLTAGPEPA